MNDWSALPDTPSLGKLAFEAATTTLIPFNRVSGVVRDENGALCDRMTYIVTRDEDPPRIIYSQMSDAVTGEYEFPMLYDKEVSRVVVSQADNAPLLNDIIDRVIPG